MSNVVRFHRFMFPVLFVVGAFGLVAPVQSTVGAEDTILMPVVEGEWWRIADDDPDVSPFRIVSDGTSNTCDFTSYQDAQGMWHAILHFDIFGAMPGGQVQFAGTAGRVFPQTYGEQMVEFETSKGQAYSLHGDLTVE